MLQTAESLVYLRSRSWLSFSRLVPDLVLPHFFQGAGETLLLLLLFLAVVSLALYLMMMIILLVLLEHELIGLQLVRAFVAV